ncbi:acyl-CoA thioesterase II [Novosphingobium sp. Gsoil 351]|uniref:acyl-CoA thioesterase n=1 Tax=Novosphingobium sp. Gsoil 351 TaxID=2675225 RepID=UPI0012B4864E|nr:acyl-CoA thioesterase II [Novosphingobium sp. Gsoil 351]QGN53263.1 acyl-CoA thioesterase II [Novosphingobium sp. Gsoil 351]
MSEADAPAPEHLVRWLVKLLDVKPGVAPDSYVGRRKRGGVGRVFGGQVIAQALAAAERTVLQDREAHSLHAYFLRGGSEDHEIEFAVARDLDGGSFSNRRVVASQQGRPILNLTASFHRREEGVSHQDEMPDVHPPEDLPSERELRLKYASEFAKDRQAAMLAPRPIELRPAEKRHWMGGEPGLPLANTWFRAVAPLPNDPRIHRAVLAYASDMTLLGTCTMPHGLSWARGNVMGVSLDHAVWFHDDVRADQWLLYATDSTWAGRGRGMNRGRIFTRDGRLVASTAQEGLIRVLDKPRS